MTVDVVERSGQRWLPFELEWPGDRLADDALRGDPDLLATLEQLVECVDVCSAALQLHALAADLTSIETERRRYRTLASAGTARGPGTIARLDVAAGDAEDRTDLRVRWSALPPPAHIDAVDRIARHSVVAVLNTMAVLLDRLATDPRLPDDVGAVHGHFGGVVTQLRRTPLHVDTLLAVRGTTQRVLDAFAWRGPARSHPG